MESLAAFQWFFKGSSQSKQWKIKLIWKLISETILCIIKNVTLIYKTVKIIFVLSNSQCDLQNTYKISLKYFRNIWECFSAKTLL